MKLIKLLESKATKSQALLILQKNNIDSAEKIVQFFDSNDKSNNQKNIPFMSMMYVNGESDLNNIVSVFNHYDDLFRKNRIKSININDGKLTIGEITFDNFIKFSEYIHGLKNKYSEKTKSDSVRMDDEDSDNKDIPIWSDNGIDIYDGADVGRCIKYTQGNLTGKSYSFCIGQPGNTKHKSYRDTKGSTFYYIVDKNRIKKNEDGSLNLNDPLHIVVFDVTNKGPLLTDADNDTGKISEYGTDVDSYIEYLKSKNVPVESLLKNKPKTEQEKYEDELLGKPNYDLKWFIKLPYEYKSKYIGRGHALTDEQFNYLISK
jgi:hypothetical protein